MEVPCSYLCSVIGFKLSVVGEQCPYDAGILVSERHGGHVIVASLHYSCQPTVGLVGLALSYPEHRSSSVDQQGAQIAVAAFTYTQQGLLAAAGILPWHQPQPGCQLSAILEILRITDRSYQGACRDRANAGDLRQFSAGGALRDPLIFRDSNDSKCAGI